MNTLLENRFRSILSLLGISIGIMSIVIIFSVVNSLEKTLNQSVTTLGENVIYIQKWPWSYGKDYEWWKFFRHPNVSFEEFKFINEKSNLSQNVAFVFSDEINLENNNVKMRDVDALAVTDQIFNIWDLKLHSGRFFTKNEVASSKNFIVIGYEIYKNLFNEGCNRKNSFSR